MRRKELKKSAVALFLAVSLAIGTAGCGEVVVSTDEKKTMDTTEDVESKKETDIPRAQDDYYGYINKEALLKLPVNYKSTRLGSDNDMQEQVDREIFEMITDISNSAEEFEDGSSEQLVRDFYMQAKDYADGKDCGARAEFLKIAGQIHDISDVDGCKEMLGTLADRGMTAIFRVKVGVNYFKGNEYAAYLEQLDFVCGSELKELYENDSVRKEMQRNLINVLVTAGEEPDTAKEKANDLIYALIDIGRDTDFSVREAANPFVHYNYMTNGELNGLFQNITVEEIRDIYKIGSDNKGFLVNDGKQLKAIDGLFTEEHVEVLKTWMLYEVLYEYRFFLENDYAFIPKEFNVPELAPDEKACAATATIMQDQMNELYAKYYYTEEMDKQITKMFADIIASYEELIGNADWLSGEMRTRLLKKLHNMNFVKGGGKFPDRNPDDQNLIGENVFETYVNIHKKKIDEYAGLLSKKVDKEESVMASHIVNAAYSPTNTFTIPVAIMHAPYFDVNADYATNLGGLGMVMAHEIGHAFDSNCIVFDENGAYSPETVPEADKQVLKERAEEMESYFSSFAVLKVYHVDGTYTSGENYADKGAMECLMNIVESRDERKKLFENYARIWMQLYEDTDLLWQLNEDEHSPNMVRVNGILSATPEFYEVYEVKGGDGMYVEEDKRVRRW